MVPLSSQLQAPAAAEADLVRGLVGTHVGALHDEATSRALADELDRCRGD